MVRAFMAMEALVLGLFSVVAQEVLRVACQLMITFVARMFFFDRMEIRIGNSIHIDAMCEMSGHDVSDSFYARAHRAVLSLQVQARRAKGGVPCHGTKYDLFIPESCINWTSMPCGVKIDVHGVPFAFTFADNAKQ